ncbi:MAG: competence/damage-inducible protein A, partial [Myxococcota bacterium]
MTAAVLSIGTELTRGELVNSNAAWLGDQLTAVGLEVRTHLTVGDDLSHIGGVLRRMAAEARVIVATGGLGPTSDDITARSVATALGVELVRDQASFEHIKRLYASRGRELAGKSAEQADFPAGATILPNGIGTAPGFAVDAFGARAFFLPGVPREMKSMFREAVLKHIASLGTRTT